MNIAPLLRRHSPSGAFSLFIAPLFFLVSTFLQAQAPLKWDKTIGGINYEELNALLVVPDGIVAGGSSSSGISYGHPADISWNIFFVKLDNGGNVVWTRFYATEPSRDDRIWAMIPTSDGGFLAGGYSVSGIGGAKTDSCRGDYDVWLVKLDKNGNLLWDKTFGGQGRDEIFSILELPANNGYLLGGHSKSNRFAEKSEDSRGDQDIWMIRIDSLGNKIWDKTIGGDRREQFHDMAFAHDGNVLLGCSTNSSPNSGEMGSDPGRGGMDYWLVKMNPLTGQLIWNHRYGGDNEDVVYSICVSQFGGIYIGGRTMSGQGPGKNAMFYGGISDFWLIKTDDNGGKAREWGFGGDGLDDLKYVHEDFLGNVLLAGDTDSGISGTKTTGRHGGYDFWLISLNKLGEINWEKTVGGNKNDDPTKIVACPGGSFLVGGHSDSPIGFEKSENPKGKNDLWIVSFCCDLNASIDKLGNPDPCSNEPLTLDATVAGCGTCQYLWSDGQTTPSIELLPGTADTFGIFILSADACFARDSLFAKVDKAPELRFDLKDTSVFEYSYIEIGGNNPELQYKWNTGDTSASIVIAYGGVYALTVTDPNGCTARDWINVRVVKKEHVWVPNVFTPNFDGTNDVLNVYTDKSVRQVLSFQIADRWGTIYYKRDNFVANYETDGWDGQFRGTRVPPGLYTWFARVEFIDGKKDSYFGTVFLKR